METINIVVIIPVLICLFLFLGTDCTVIKTYIKQNISSASCKENLDTNENAPVLGDTPDDIGIQDNDLNTTPPKDTQIEKYTNDFYPWWRSPRWWNYDGWLYNRPYYNYWRRPAYYNMWFSGNPIRIGGKTFYKTEY